jgi:hypothetical protein
MAVLPPRPVRYTAPACPGAAPEHPVRPRRNVTRRRSRQRHCHHVTVLLRLLGYARPHWRVLAVAVVAMTTESAVRTIPAWFSKTVIERAAADGTPWFLFLIVLG